ncbi:MAG: class I SAM-dependent methyltransferase [Spirochaetales bacterium]|nr:class I SAM-dependent methyltransferase [Spirochaetales bacterium]
MSKKAERLTWDERYSTEEYAYGTTPNDFLKERYRSIPMGRVLSLAEGEGRNAVFLAKQGYVVTAVDASRVGLHKAEKLADEHGVDIDFVHADITEFDIGEHQWDGIISVFVPLPSVRRRELHKKVIAGLKPRGVFLLEAYTPDQLKYGTGGGTSVDTMTSKESLRSELEGLTFVHLSAIERNVVEGVYHTGLGAVVQAIATKEA